MIAHTGKQAFASADKEKGMGQTLILSIGFSVSLVLFRVFYTGQLMFLFLIWNLFLAYLPLGLSFSIYSRRIAGIKTLAALGAWLLLIPNSFYILTDLFHLETRPEIPLWFDLALIVSFAWNGLLMGISSVRHIERLISIRFGHKACFPAITGIMFLNALGIYIGRYLRYNSWDVVSSPIRLTHDVIYLFVHPVRNRFEWGMIICFTILLTLIYQTLKKTGGDLGQ